MTKAELLKEIIITRKSTYVAEYSDEAISEEIIKEIVSSANYAPNHKRTYPWRMRVFQGDEKTDLATQMMRFYKETASAESFSDRKMQEIGQKVQKAYAIITISINFSGKVPQWEEIAATAMAVQNMYLTCTAHQVGCYWSTPSYMVKLKDFLALEPQQECYGFFYIGKMAAI